MTADRRRLFALALGCVALMAGGIAYVSRASGNVSDDIDIRGVAAAAEIEQFEAPNSSATHDDPGALSNRSGQAVDPTSAATGGEPGVGAPVSAADDASEPPSTAIPAVVFIHRAPGPDYGRLGLRHPDGTRTLLEPTCERAHVAAGYGVCMSRDDGLVATFTSTSFRFDEFRVETVSTRATTLPSRARLSPGGTWAATTSFLSGTSYDDIDSGGETLVHFENIGGADESVTLNSFRIDVGDPDGTYLGRQFWGPTFSDDDHFYVTGHFGDDPEIMQGSLAARKLWPTGISGSCPSLSPDGSMIIVKRARAAGSGFDLLAIDLENDVSFTLAESRSVDDQVEWLDNDTLIYALHRDDVPATTQPEFDIWMIDVNSHAEPELFLPFADSPAALQS